MRLVNCNKATWVPFSYGPRNWEAVVSLLEYHSDFRLAMMELRMIMAMFLWHYDVEFTEQKQMEPEYRDAFIAKRGPPITPVDRSENKSVV
jgi:hypothetical protein